MKVWGKKGAGKEREREEQKTKEREGMIEEEENRPRSSERRDWRDRKRGTGRG